MKKFFLFVLIILISGLVFNQNNQNESKTNESQIVNEEDIQNLPRLWELGSKKCIPCQKMEPILEELRKDHSKTLKVEFVDVWLKENKEIAQKYKISSIPTQIFEDANGNELFRHTGFISKEDILSKWKELGYDMEIKSKPENTSTSCCGGH